MQAAMKECDTNDDGALRVHKSGTSGRPPVHRRVRASRRSSSGPHALDSVSTVAFLPWAPDSLVDIRQAPSATLSLIDEFLDMAVIVYDLIDEDMNGTLAKEELVKACGEVSGGVFFT